MSPRIDGKLPKTTPDAPVPSVDTTKAQLPVSATLEHTESAEDKSHRISVAVLLAIMGALLLFMATKASGTAVFALSNALDSVQLPKIEVPAVPCVIIGALLCLGSAAGLFLKAPPKVRTALNIAAGLGFVAGFLAWAAGGRTFDFLVTNQFNGTLAYATPLIFGALGGLLGERAGVVNVAIEAQFLSGAFAAALVGTMTKSLLWGMVAGAVVGVAMGALLALFSVKYLVDQVVMGVVLNSFATGLTGYLYSQFITTAREQYNDTPLFQAVRVPVLADIPFIGPILFQQKPMAYMAFASVVLVWFLLFRTKWGLRVRAVGEHPEAAETVGINVRAVRWQAVLLGGVFAGIGGTYFVLSVSGQFIKSISSGMGFIAIAAFIMGRWRPGLAALMCVFFGFVTQLSTQVQNLQTGLDSRFLVILPYVATIVAVAGLVGRVRAPKADGTNYDK
ncbi:MAG: ABC transporter permease [Propionibacteriaceae bacterium]|jgi:simple sugar transport system permease protein|nr:ABC transporter permease [Propionibacteriaceae bacterium]